jgi:UDPglucose 6-dehydrogenase
MAGCLSKTNHNIIGLDFNQKIVDDLNSSTKLPVYEPQLLEIIREGKNSGKLTFVSNFSQALLDVDVWWICYDTKVDEKNQANIDEIIESFEAGLNYVKEECIVIFSSQLPVGTIRMLKEKHRRTILSKSIKLCCVPENLRLGDAVRTFLNTDRFIVGTDSDDAFFRISSLLQSFSEVINRVSIESAEMIKHAINTFLALEIAYINEIAEICKIVGANSLEVSQGLKTDQRIGQKAYLRPGAGFGGVTLERDVTFLENLIAEKKTFAPVIDSIKPSNLHRNAWLLRNIMHLYKEAKVKKISFLGLTYKPDTNTLRGSIAMDAIKSLKDLEIEIRIFDELGLDLSDFSDLELIVCGNLDDAINGADCLVVGNLSPALIGTNWKRLLDSNQELVILDQSGLIYEDINLKGVGLRYLTSI